MGILNSIGVFFKVIGKIPKVIKLIKETQELMQLIQSRISDRVVRKEAEDVQRAWNDFISL